MHPECCKTTKVPTKLFSVQVCFDMDFVSRALCDCGRVDRVIAGELVAGWTSFGCSEKAILIRGLKRPRRCGNHHASAPSSSPAPPFPARCLLDRFEMVWLRVMIRWGFRMRVKIGEEGKDHRCLSLLTQILECTLQ